MQILCGRQMEFTGGIEDSPLIHYPVLNMSIFWNVYSFFPCVQFVFVNIVLSTKIILKFVTVLYFAHFI